MRCFTADFQAGLGRGSATLLRIARTPHFVGRDIDEVGIGILHCVKAGLNAAHRVDIFNLTLFAGRDNQRRSPCCNGTFDLKTGSGDDLSISPTLTSMNVRRQLFLQK